MGCAGFRVVFGEAVVQAEVEPRLGLAGRDLRIERLWLRARDVPHVLPPGGTVLPKYGEFSALVVQRGRDAADARRAIAQAQYVRLQAHIRKDFVLGYDPSIS